MTSFRVDARELRDFLGAFPRGAERAIARAQASEVRPYLLGVAQAVTDEEDAVASGRYRAGFRYERMGPTDWQLTNEADHAPFVEYGRRAGRYPPREAIRRWMAFRGIPDEALFPIMRAIARRGTVARKGYKGFAIFDKVYRRVGDRAFRILDAAFDRAMRETK